MRATYELRGPRTSAATFWNTGRHGIRQTRVEKEKATECPNANFEIGD
jgi:hypothetical protein